MEDCPLNPALEVLGGHGVVVEWVCEQAGEVRGLERRGKAAGEREALGTSRRAPRPTVGSTGLSTLLTAWERRSRTATVWPDVGLQLGALLQVAGDRGLKCQPANRGGVWPLQIPSSESKTSKCCRKQDRRGCPAGAAERQGVERALGTKDSGRYPWLPSGPRYPPPPASE